MPLRKFTISVILEIQCQSELSEATGPIRATLPSNQAESGGALLSQRYHVNVARTTTPTMDSNRWE